MEHRQKRMDMRMIQRKDLALITSRINEISTMYDFIFQPQNLTSFSFFSLFVDLTNPKREFPLWRRYS